MTEDKRDWQPVAGEAIPVDETCNGSTEPMQATETKKSRLPGPVPGEIEPFDDPPFTPPVPLARTKVVGVWGVAIWTGIALFFAWFIVGLFQTIQAVMVDSYVLGVPLVILAIVFTAALVLALVREVRAFREINRLDEETRALAVAAENNSVFGFLRALEPRLNVIRNFSPEDARQFEEASRAAADVHRVQQLFANILLPDLERKAEAVIEREALQTSVAVAILPHPALDAAIVVWRGCIMVRKVGEIYGIRMTALSSVRLLKHVIASATLAAGAETLGGIVAEEAAGGIVATFVKPLGEASITYIRVCRLGKFCKAMMVPGILAR